MDEFIKRQDAIDELMEMVKDYSGDQFGGVLLHYTGIKAMLECVEPACVKPVVLGNWKEHIFDGIMGGRPRTNVCSHCLYTFPIQTPFCPNCGSYNGGDAE